MIRELSNSKSQNMVRFQFWQARDGVDLDTEHDAVKWNLHVLHCFEYLRQAISCGGDLIIEGSSPIKVGNGKVNPLLFIFLVH